MKKAIDVSSYQGVIDWDAVKEDGVEFAVIRGGFGDDLYKQDDEMFRRNWGECLRVGIPCAMYFFSYAAAKDGDVSSELAHIRRLMRDKERNCAAPVYIDVENTKGLDWRAISDEKLLEIMKRFKEGLAKMGLGMGIYSSRSAFWNEKMRDAWYGENVSVWVAEYADKISHFDRPVDLWQYSSRGSVKGIRGRVDLDRLYADFTDPAPDPDRLSVRYQVCAGKRWLPEVTDRQDYAGNFGQSVTAVYAAPNAGNLYYRAHTLRGKWLPEVKNRQDYAGIIGRKMDGFMIRSDAGRVLCQAHLKGGKWLPPVSGYDENDPKNGYAGILGREIDALYIWGEKEE